MPFSPEQLKALLAEAQELKATLLIHGDPNASYWRSHLAQRIYEIRVQLGELSERRSVPRTEDCAA